jgi:hypothetical protein
MPAVLSDAGHPGGARRPEGRRAHVVADAVAPLKPGPHRIEKVSTFKASAVFISIYS